MNNTKVLGLIFGGILISIGIMGFSSDKQPVEFYTGHTHENGETHGAPSHSGGTDSRGCHNASVPYHCH